MATPQSTPLRPHVLATHNGSHASVADGGSPGPGLALVLSPSASPRSDAVFPEMQTPTPIGPASKFAQYESSTPAASTTPTPGGHISRLIGRYEQDKTAAIAGGAPPLSTTSTPPRSLSTSGSNGGVAALVALLSPADRRASAPPLASTVTPSPQPPSHQRASLSLNTPPKMLPPPLPQTPAQVPQHQTPPSLLRLDTRSPPQSSLLQVLPTSPTNLSSPRTPRKRPGTIDDSTVEAVGSYSHPPGHSRTPSHTRTPSLVIPVARSSPNASPGRERAALTGAAAIRHKLKSFRTLPMNLPSAAAALAAFEAEECKNNDSPVPRSLSGSYPVPLTPSNPLSPTHLTYWDKRNIWVAREQEEMRAKHNLKKVLRKINDSNLIVRSKPKWTPPPPRVSQPQTAKPGGANPSKSVSPPDTIPSPPFAARASSMPPPLPVFPPAAVITPSAAGAMSPVSPVPNGVSLPSPSFPAITISELSMAASHLNLTGHLGRLEFARDCAVHLAKMEHHACTFNSAPQLMWALKALTITEDEAVRENVNTPGAARKKPPPLSQTATPSSPSAYVSMAQLNGSELFRQKRAAVEAIIAEQGFAPTVVQYIRAHTFVPAGAVALAKEQPPPSHSKASLSEPPHLATLESTLSAVPPPVPAYPHPPHKASMSVAGPAAVAVVGGGASTSSTRSNSLQTELDHEWSRRHIPRVRLRTVAQRVTAKLAEEAEELEEKRRAIVQKMLAMNIWATDSPSSGTTAASSTSTTTTGATAISHAPLAEEVLASLSHHRFDLLRFTFELTELAEMEGRNIRFSSLAQAMASLRVLYEKLTPTQINDLCAQHSLPSHVQAYLEARRSEIANSRDERPKQTEGTRSWKAKAAINVFAPSTSGGASSPLSPNASPLSHHRSISLVEFVEVLAAGNLLVVPPGSTPGTAPPVAPTAAGLAWLLADAGLDLAEVSIDDLIQMQQNPLLARSFHSARQVVQALTTLYTEHDESEVVDMCRRETMDPRVRTFLVEAQRHSTAMHAMVEGPLFFNAAGGGGKRSRVQRVKRQKELRAKVVQYELQELEMDLEVELEDSDHPERPKQQPKYQTYALQLSDRSALLARDRVAHPLPSLSASDICSALRSMDGLVGEASLSEPQMSTLVTEMSLQLTEDCELDLADLNALKTAGVPFATHRQLLVAMQLLNVECAQDELHSSCERAGFAPKAIEYLMQHSRASVQARVLAAGASRGTDAAKYALLEMEVQRLEWEEMEGDDDGEVAIEHATTSRARPKASFAVHELSMDESHMLDDAALVTVSDLSARLHTSSLLMVPADGSAVTPGMLAQLVTRMGMPIARLERELLWEDIGAMEQQGGLKFKSPRALLCALTMLQDEALMEEELFFEAVAGEQFSPSVTTFLLQLHRSPARAAKQAVVRRRRAAPNSAAASAQRSIMLRSLIAEEEEEALCEELVTASALARHMTYHSVLEDGMMVESSELAPLILSTSIEHLPEHRISRDLAALSQQGLKLRTARQVVQVLDFLHREDMSADELQRELPIATDPATRAKHMQFLLHYRKMSMTGVEFPIQAAASSARQQPRTAHTVVEADFIVDEVDMSNAEATPTSAEHARLASALALALRTANVVGEDVSCSGADVAQACCELSFHLDSIDLDHATLLIERAVGQGAKVRDLRHVVMALQMVDESALEADEVAVSRSTSSSRASLPPLYAEFVTTRSDRSQRLRASLHRRRESKKLAMPAKVQHIAMSLEQMEDELEEVEWIIEDVSTEGRARARTDLRTFCTEMDLDLSQVTLDEVRVLKAHARKCPASAKQAVEVLKLMQYDCAGQLTKDKLLTELERLEQASGGPRSTPTQLQQTVRMVLDLEEQLTASVEETTTHQRQGSKQPPPLPWHGGVQIHVAPSAAVSASPDPPPFPKHLVRISLDDTDSGNLTYSPPVPAYPYAPAPPTTTSGRHHVRFHSHENLLTPERQYEGLVEHINELGLAKSPYSSIADLPMPVSSLNFTRLLQQINDMQELKRSRGVRGALYDTPAHCIRCLYADVLPTALMGDGAPSLVSPSLTAARSASRDSDDEDEFDARTHPSSAASADANAALIAQHIRNSSHFRKGKPGEEIPPLQETESPMPHGCCGKSACAIQ